MRDMCQRERQEAPIGIEMVKPKSREEEGNVQDKYQRGKQAVAIDTEKGDLDNREEQNVQSKRQRECGRLLLAERDRKLGQLEGAESVRQMSAWKARCSYRRRRDFEGSRK